MLVLVSLALTQAQITNTSVTNTFAYRVLDRFNVDSITLMSVRDPWYIVSAISACVILPPSLIRAVPHIRRCLYVREGAIIVYSSFCSVND